MKQVEKHFPINVEVLNKKLNLDNINIAFGYFLNNLPSIDEMKQFQEDLKNKDCKTARITISEKDEEIIDFIADEYKLSKKSAINLVLETSKHLPLLQSKKKT